MLLPVLAVLIGLALLVWSANRFVDGAACSANYFGMPALLIGMLIVGFGTSAPEIVVSILSALEGSPGIALGNAYGSNIANIGLILGCTALVSPIVVQSRILRKELPILAALTILSAVLLYDLRLSRIDAGILLALFVCLMGWSIYHGLKKNSDADADTFGTEEEAELSEKTMSLKLALFWLVIGLLVLVGSSRLLVWGAIEVAREFGVDDIIIGLTIVAIGTSLPELASTMIAARKGEDDIALGSVLGSNLFNTLAVVGLAGAIHPFDTDSAILTRDMVIMGALTVALFIMGASFRGKQGGIDRVEGAILLTVYVSYTIWLIMEVVMNRPTD